MKLVFLNTTIITCEGIFTCEKITNDRAKEIVNSFDDNDMLSAVGHESTSGIMSELLGVSVPVNRIQYTQETEDVCLAFKLKGRPPEGAILNREEIENIGYEWYRLKKYTDGVLTSGGGAPLRVSGLGR